MLEARTRSRRFLPGDPRVQEPYRLTPQVALRVAMLGFLALAAFAILFLRLWALQILSRDRYLQQANQNRVRVIPQPAPRGVIVDRRGRVLVRNTLGTSIELWPADLPTARKERAGELRHGDALRVGAAVGRRERDVHRVVQQEIGRAHV